jgi:hypothetical protein
VVEAQVASQWMERKVIVNEQVDRVSVGISQVQCA